MKLEGTYTFDVPRDEVWQALLDPDVLAKILPGCEQLEKIGENEYNGALNIKVGPVQGLFRGKVTLTDIVNHESYRLLLDGRGAPGFVKGEGHVRLEAEGDTTRLHYHGDAQVGGRIAGVGQRLLDSSAKAITRQSLDGLNRQIQARRQPDGSGESPPAPQAPSQTQFAAGVAREMLNDFLPPEKRPTFAAALLGGLALFLIFNLLGNWWLNRLAHRLADVLAERDYR